MGMDELPVLPGFREMALRRMAAQRSGLVRDLVAQRLAAGLSQTEVAARMGTSRSPGSSPVRPTPAPPRSSDTRPPSAARSTGA
jgi:hypothetical protein